MQPKLEEPPSAFFKRQFWATFEDDRPGIITRHLLNVDHLRLSDLRQRLWSDLAGKPDPNDPTKTIRPEGETLATLINAALRISRHEAMVFGLDAPTKSEVMAAVTGQTVTDEELDIWLGRLTPQERETFMMLLAKAQGRWVAPPAIDEGSVETTATTVQSNGAGS
jgi:hypothetical protein